MNIQRISSPLASAIRIPSTWEKLELSKEEALRLEKFVLQIHRRERYGSGPLALFVGPSKTAKTLTASWLADRLGIPLFRVDLAAVTNKYIGETEKNLSALLSRAEKKDMILFFDEADSLFGKRTEVNDRLARKDILEKLLKFQGIAILSATTEKTEESALKEQLSLILNFSSEED